MPTNHLKHFVPTLHVVLGLLIATNVVALFNGRLLALVTIGVQLTVLGSVYLNKSWACIAVKLWALVVMLTGLAMWLAVLLGGAEFFHSLFNTIFKSVMLVVGLYFFKFAEPALRHGVAE